jgi:DUF1365 family protein
MMDAIATGTVWHRRDLPRQHSFRYRLYFSLLDLDRLESTFSRCRLWSIERFNLVAFRRRDFLGPHDRPLAETVRGRVDEMLGFRPKGPIRMLTHLRQWGFCFNPVTFYFCEHEGQLGAIVADIHNTPWNERHDYVLDARSQAGPDYRFRFDKDFHVSPFMPMAMNYDWRFRLEDDRIDVHMLLIEDDRQCFRAGMSLALAPLTQRAMRWQPLRFPAVTVKVVAGIYWQAFRLWAKRIPFHPHPDSREEPS